MLLLSAYTLYSEQVPQKSFIQTVQEICIETEPKPLFCELPDDLKIKSASYSGTTQTYTITSSMISLARVGNTSTTTTL